MIDLKIIPDEGEPYELHITSRIIVVWERTTKGMTFKRLMDELSFNHLYNLSWRAARAKGLYSGTLEDWESSVDLEILVEDEGDGDGEADPTHAGASSGP